MTRISAKQYWNRLFVACAKKSNKIPKRYFYLITNNKKLQKKIDEDVIKEFLSDKDNVELLLSDISYDGVDTRYVTQSCLCLDIESIILQYYYVDYLNDEYIEITRK